MRRNLPQIAIQVTEPQKEWIENESEKLGISKAEFLRRIIDHYRQAGPTK